jgi:hypothetical protein
MYNKTTGYSTSATQTALADACAAVPLLLQVLVPSRSFYTGISVSIWLIFFFAENDVLRTRHML